MSPELQQAVKERVELGHSQEQITNELREAGYDDATIEAVYEATVAGESQPVVATETELPPALDLFKQAWKFAWSRLDLVLIVALPTIIMDVVSVMSDLGWIPIGIPTVIGLIVGFILLVVVQIILQLVLAYTAFTTQQYSAPTLSYSWKWAVQHLWPWLWISAISFFVAFGGLLLLIVPGVIVSVYIAFATYVFIDEEALGMSALQRSRELMIGSFWKILSRLMVFILILLGLSVVAVIGVTLLASALGAAGTGVQELTLPIFSAILTTFASVLSVYFAAALYRALKQQFTTPVAPTGAYPVLGWLGVVTFTLFAILSGLSIAAFMTNASLNNVDWRQMMTADIYDQTLEQQAELTPEQQAEFDAFMEEFGEELGSY